MTEAELEEIENGARHIGKDLWYVYFDGLPRLVAEVRRLASEIGTRYVPRTIAEAAVAHEREACAKLGDEMVDALDGTWISEKHHEACLSSTGLDRCNCGHRDVRAVIAIASAIRSRK